MTKPATHKFRAAEIECTALLDGTAQYPAPWFFQNAPEGQLRA